MPSWWSGLTLLGKVAVVGGAAAFAAIGTGVVIEATKPKPLTAGSTGPGGSGPGGTTGPITVALDVAAWPVAVPAGSTVTFVPGASDPTGTVTLDTFAGGVAAGSAANVAVLTAAGSFTLTLDGTAIPMTYDGTNLVPQLSIGGGTPGANPIVFDAGEQYGFALTATAPLGTTKYASFVQAYLDQLEDMNGQTWPGTFVVVPPVQDVSKSGGVPGRAAGTSFFAKANCLASLTLNLVPEVPNPVTGATVVSAVGVTDEGPSATPNRQVVVGDQVGPAGVYVDDVLIVTFDATAEQTKQAAAGMTVVLPLAGVTYSSSSSILASSPGDNLYSVVATGTAEVAATFTDSATPTPNTWQDVVTVMVLSTSTSQTLDATGDPISFATYSGTFKIFPPPGGTFTGDKTAIDGTGVTAAVNEMGTGGIIRSVDLTLSGKYGTATVAWEVGGDSMTTEISFVPLASAPS